MENRLRSRQRVREGLSIWKGAKLSEVVGEGALIGPDCQEFAKDHPGVEPPQQQLNKFLGSERNWREKARSEGDW